VPQLTDAALTGLNPTVLASPQLQPFVGLQTQSSLDRDRCNCQKRSGKKRKCLERAQLSWRSGRKKGKPAGSRCVRFAN
jgi:hypothetical protein